MRATHIHTLVYICMYVYSIRAYECTNTYGAQSTAYRFDNTVTTTTNTTTFTAMKDL